MKSEIINKTKEYVKSNVPKSREPKDRYYNHVFGVVEYALLLGKEMGADLFILEMAALLHDIGADDGKTHAAKSAEMAKKYLKQFKLDQEDMIIGCVRNHSMGSTTENIEEQIIQDADGLIFLKETYKDFYVHFEKEIREDGGKWLLSKLNGMTDKVKTEKGLELARPFLENAIKDIRSWKL